MNIMSNHGNKLRTIKHLGNQSENTTNRVLRTQELWTQKQMQPISHIHMLINSNFIIYIYLLIYHVSLITYCYMGSQSVIINLNLTNLIKTCFQDECDFETDVTNYLSDEVRIRLFELIPTLYPVLLLLFYLHIRPKETTDCVIGNVNTLFSGGIQ